MRYKVYTCGKMFGTTMSQQMEWRRFLQQALDEYVDYTHKDIHVDYIHPPLFYSYEQKYQQSEREIKDFELAKIQECDVVVVNLNNIEESVGSMYELATIDAHNKSGGKHIFVIGIGEKPKHPWIKLSLHRIERNIPDAIHYISDYIFT